MIVVDSSAVVEWLLGLPNAAVVGNRLVSAGSIHAPALLDVEVAQVVRRYAIAGEISLTVGARAISVLGELDLERHSHQLLLPLIWRLRNNLTAYDAAFVALAAVLDAPLVTLDTRMAGAPLPHLLHDHVTIEVLGGRREFNE